MANIKQMKSVYYKEESNFGEAYDVTASFQEIAVSDLEVNREPEDLTTLFMNKTRVLDEDHASGRTNGSCTFKKPMDTSLMKNHLSLVGTALGTVVASTDTDTVSSVAVTSNIVTLTVADSSNFTVGQLVQFVDSTGLKFAINRIKALTDATTVVLEYRVCNDEVDRYSAVASGKLYGVSYVRPSVPDMTKTYQFVVVYQDDSVEVFRGASAKASFTINLEGKAELDFEVMGAEVQSVNSVTKTALTIPTGTITPEDSGNPVIFNFQTSEKWDFKNDALVMDFPYSLGIEFGNTIEPIKKTGCLNNIGGWYIKPSISGTVDFERTPNNLVNYSKIFEGTSPDESIFFTSNADFAFFAQRAKFTNQDAKNVDSFDSIHCRINVNSWTGTNSEPFIVLPQTFA